MRAVSAPMCFVRARYDEQETSEASRCITTVSIDERRAFLLANQMAANEMITDVVVIMRDQVTSVFQIKGVDWFSVEMLNALFPGWRLVQREEMPQILAIPGSQEVLRSTQLIMAFNDQNEPEGVQLIERGFAAVEQAPETPGPEPQSNPSAA